MEFALKESEEGGRIMEGNARVAGEVGGGVVGFGVDSMVEVMIQLDLGREGMAGM